MRIDLHTHSAISDGTDTPAELIAKAAAIGLDAISLTDHDTFAGLPQARAAATTHGIQFLAGIEFSTRYEYRTVHLLGYGTNTNYAPLNAELAKIRKAREQRIAAILNKLSGLGIHLASSQLTPIIEEKSSVGRPHIADALVAAGHVKNRDEAFTKYLADDGPAYVNHYSTELTVAIALIHAAGGVAVIAHPWARKSRDVLTPEALTSLALTHHLDGIEIDHQDHDATTREKLRELANKLNLLVTGSSDYHGSGKIGYELGSQTTDLQVFAEIQRRISAP